MGMSCTGMCSGPAHPVITLLHRNYLRDKLQQYTGMVMNSTQPMKDLDFDPTHANLHSRWTSMQVAHGCH